MSFDRFHLPGPIAQAARELNYEEPTPIQEKAIPLIMQGKDVVGQSETGSGKTAAFGLPVLGSLKGQGVQMLVLTPTRELCVQVAGALSRFSRHARVQVATVYGGVGINPQISALRTAQVAVACPGRLLDIIGQGAVDLRNVRYLVLDEADRMFDMGFIRDIEKILRHIPQDRQTLLFSATIPPPVRQLVQKYMRSPVFIETMVHVDKSKLREAYYEVVQEDKFALLLHLLKHETPGMALVFCGKRHVVDKVARNLKKNGIDAMAIHGGLSQNKRDAAINALHNKDTAVLVATDIAARGLHIRDISHVYNFDLPNVAEDYTHRIGRTARAGAQGDAVTLLCDRDRGLLRPILQLGHVMTKLPLPAFERIAPAPGLGGGAVSEDRPHGFRQRRFTRASSEGQNTRTGFHRERGPSHGFRPHGRGSSSEEGRGGQRSHDGRGGYPSYGRAPAEGGQRSEGGHRSYGRAPAEGGQGGEDGRSHGGYSSYGRSSDGGGQRSRDGHGGYRPQGGYREGRSDENKSGSGERSHGHRTFRKKTPNRQAWRR